MYQPLECKHIVLTTTPLGNAHTHTHAHAHTYASMRTHTHLISLSIVVISSTRDWFLANILALGHSDQLNQSPYLAAILAVPLTS